MKIKLLNKLLKKTLFSVLIVVKSKLRLHILTLCREIIMKTRDEQKTVSQMQWVNALQVFSDEKKKE